ncbi:uncharacterized protein LOC125680233 [Ostrea edulis]|uniref:uncharacterized protein LOC125680233 n=1 Tax=Ostrea edulis TaxID=37623 RepID=UPI0024AF5174|nr:uncharacterized protein LOC125680233 [Ostrea edulis]
MQIRKIKNIAKCSKTMELQSIVHSFLSIILVAKCCAAGNVSTESNLQARLGFHPVEFKCHYTLGPHETVHARNISWQIESVTGSGQFETIAEFSLPNAPRQSNQYVTTSVGTDFKTRSALLNVVSSGSNSYTAVFRLIEVRCEDEGNFRCSVVFSSTSGSTTVSSDVSLFLTAPAEKPYRAPGPIPDDLEEGMSVKFSCTANVGKPPGNIKWWRYQQGRSVPNFMGQSDTVPLMKTDVCAYNVTSYISAFTMSRNDDKSVWRCSVNNNLLTAYPDYDKPYEETKGIRVYYKVETPSIEVIPKGPRYEVGASLTIYCTADGNPSPLIDNHINYYLWIFRARGTAKDIVLTSNNGLLALQNLQVENSGKYTCTAHNSYNGKEFSSSNHIEVIIQIGKHFLYHIVSFIKNVILESLSSNLCWSGEISTIPIIQAGAGRSEVTFECNYTLTGNELVYPGGIAWEVEKNGHYEEIATFSPPDFPDDINSFSSTESGLMFMNRSELLNVTTIAPSSFYVAMRVTDLECSDENKYKCVIDIRHTAGPSPLESSSSLIFRSPAEAPYEPFRDVPHDIEEDMSYNFSCSADVGNPPGKIKWWRFRHGVLQPDFMGESLVPTTHPGLCVFNVTSSIELNMTKEDHRSVWRCSVDNELLTTSPDYNKPHQESQKINVFYPVGIPIISKVPDHSQYLNGSMVTLHCTALGNPRPNGNDNDTINKYVWTFQGLNTDNVTELSTENGTLFLRNLQEDDSGMYECFAFNGFNGKLFNASQNIEIRIVRPEAETQNTVRPEAETQNTVLVICLSVLSGLFLVTILVILFIKRHRLPYLCRCSKTSPQ